MPWQGRRGPSEAQKCHGCYTRYWQSAVTRLCRQCEKEQLSVAMMLHQIAAEQEARAEALRQMAANATQRPRREIQVDGRAFVVVWDGS